MCQYDLAWAGKCKEEGEPFCAKHATEKCESCGAQATRECPETGQFVCGSDLCDECEHTTFSDGTNGGIGFNAQSLPEGMKRHCKKTEQRYTPWYTRKPDAPSMEGKEEDADSPLGNVEWEGLK